MNDIHWILHGTDTETACGLSIYATPAPRCSSRHDQATCPGCIAAF